MIGREGELRAVLTAVAQVPAAGLVAVVVAGEAGIGKSRLLAAAAAELRGQGWRTVDVRADRLERQVPYAALGTALRTLAADNSFTADLRRAALTALDLPVEDHAFGQACALVTRLITALSAAGPVLLAVDDLHELDDDSVALLAVVLRRVAAAPIALIAALRPHVVAPNAAAEDMIDRLAERVDVVRVPLGTLSPTDLAAVVAPIVGGHPDSRLTEEIHGRSDGNPFFATEIARSLVEAGEVTVERDAARLTGAPRAVRISRRGAVLRRVVPLAPGPRAVARTLAVLRSVALERIGLIARVAGLSDAAVAEAFDDLVRGHVLTRDEGRYRFSHDIVADALYDEIGPAERRRLHRLIAEQMAVRRAGGDPVDLLELAWHVAESAEPGDAAAVGVLTEAAQRALTSAPEAAVGFCARALALAAPVRPDLLALHCRALARASRPAAAVQSGREALAALPPGEERFRTATAVIGSLFLLGRIGEALDVADEQVELGPALRAQRAVLLMFANRPQDAVTEAAIAEAAAVDASPAEQVVVHCQLAILTSMLFRHDETVAHADRALARAGLSTTLKLQALGVGASTGALAGLVHDASRRVRLADQLADEPGGPTVFGDELRLTRVVLDWLGGRWDAALEGASTLAAELETREQSTLRAALVAIELEIRTWRGELVLAAPLAERPLPPMRNMAALHTLALAGFLAARGNRDRARELLIVDDPATTSYSCLLLGRRIELELADGDRAAADKSLDMLVAAATPRVSPWSVTTLHRTVGVVRGDPEALGRAARAADQGGLVFEKARAQLALGEAAPDAVAGLVEAYLTFGRLGAHGLRRRAGRRLQALGEKVPRVRSRAAGLLTSSEEAVARLVQQGMRNRDIAAALHYSPRSIEVYLSRIYAKLRVSSRLELARALDAMDGR